MYNCSKYNYSKYNLFIVFISILVCLNLSAGIFAEETSEAKNTAEPITFIAIVKNHPFSLYHPNGAPTGLFVEFWELWSKVNGIPIQIEMMTVLESIEAVKTKGKVHTGLFKVSNRKEWADFSQPIHKIKSGIWSIKNTPKVMKLADMSGKKVSVLEGSYHQQYLEENFPAILVVPYDYGRSLNQLLNDDIQAVFSENPSTSSLIAKLGYTGLITLTEEEVFSNNVYATLAKGQPELLEIINRGIEKIPVDLIIELEKKWLPTKKAFFENRHDFQELSLYERKWLDDNSRFNFGITLNSYPYSFLDDKGNLQGIVKDYLDYASDILNVKFNPVVDKSWHESFEAFKKGDVDIMADIVKTPERSKWIEFTNPYFITTNAIVTRRDTFNVVNLSSLNNKKVGLFKGFTNDLISKHYPDIQIQIINSVRDGLGKVQSKELDAIIYVSSLINDELKALSDNDLIIAGFSPYNLELSMAVNKNIEPLANILNKVFSKMTEKEKAAINNNWVSTYIYSGTELLTIVFISLPILMILFWIIFSILRINSRLKIAKVDLEHQKSAMDAHSLVSSTDIKGVITYVNQKVCEVSGYTKEELLGGNHSLLNSDKQPKDYWQDMYLTCSKANIWHDQVRNKNKAGKYYWVDTTIVPLFEDGKISGYMSISTDITHSKKIQKNLTRAKSEAEAATVAKSQFLSTMSHEIRTPMNGVIGMAQLLKDTPLTSEQQDYVATITRSGNGLLSIINDILDFSKLDADKLVIENITFDLERVCQESMELVAGNVKDKDLEIIFDYAPECPRYFLGDPSRIRQILLNILGNAVKFTERGYIRCGVSYELSGTGEEQLRLEVQDTGIGLNPDAIEGLFDEFAQADKTTTRLYGGTGLGLTITKKLVGLMGGALGVNSVEGEGSTFWITGILTPIERLESLTPMPLKDVRILFVDDLEENCKIYKHLLEHMGAKPTAISDPSKAEELLVAAEKSKTPFEIAILDHNMSKLDGLDLGLQIRKNASLADLKLLIFSSIGQKGYAALFASAGFNGYLDKLSRYGTLREILSTILTHTTHNPIVTHHTIKDDKSNLANKPQSFSGTILIVEDNLTNQIIAKKFLLSMGLTVDIASHGQEAVEAYNNNNYDLIFMDCRMPVMDGYEATEAIRMIEQEKNLSPIPIIALTANASTDDRILCEKAGMVEVVTKPFKRADLSEVLIKWLPKL
ncbi:MAG: two-component system sensor histidine kinase/response regulator [Enterobacterales bacterium]|jgi:two-component system sensor histidine kinase/response regulator